MSDIENKARSIVCDHLSVEPYRVKDKTTFESLGADSLDLIELVMTFEERFEILIANDEAEAVLTFGDAVRLVESKTP